MPDEDATEDVADPEELLGREPAVRDLPGDEGAKIAPSADGEHVADLPGREPAVRAEEGQSSGSHAPQIAYCRSIITLRRVRTKGGGKTETSLGSATYRSCSRRRERPSVQLRSRIAAPFPWLGHDRGAARYAATRDPVHRPSGPTSPATIARLAGGWGMRRPGTRVLGGPLDVRRALEDRALATSGSAARLHGLRVWAISNHLVGQVSATRSTSGTARSCRTASGATATPRASGVGRAGDDGHRPRRVGVTVVNGFTGSSIWHALLPSRPPGVDDRPRVPDFADRWGPILDVYAKEGVRFALEVHRRRSRTTS